MKGQFSEAYCRPIRAIFIITINQLLQHLSCSELIYRPGSPSTLTFSRRAAQAATSPIADLDPAVLRTGEESESNQKLKLETLLHYDHDYAKSV